MEGFPNRSYETVEDALKDYSTLEGHIEDLCCATCEAEKRGSSGILHLVYHKEGSTSPTTQIDVSFTSPEEANALTDRLAESLADKGIERFHIGFNNAYTLWPKRHLRAVKWKRSKLNIESCTTVLGHAKEGELDPDYVRAAGEMLISWANWREKDSSKRKREENVNKLNRS